MLSKKRRIQRELFPKILKEGKRYNSQNLLLYILQIPSVSRFSFSVSKKVCKLAVDRNKFRRRGYSILNKHLKDIKPGYLCFFSFKKGSSKITFTILEQEILDLLKTYGVIL